MTTPITTPRLLGNDLRGERFAVAGTADRGPRTYVNSVAPGYLDTLGIRLLRGRDFAATDRPGGPPVAIVSEAFVRAHFRGADALGQLVELSTGGSAAIVGVVSDHAYRNRGGRPEPVLYRAFAQIPNMSTQPRPLIIHVRTDQPAERSISMIRRAMSELDASRPALVEPLGDATSQELVMRRVLGGLLSSIGFLGLLLASIGLYGVMAYVVTSRTAEIAIRMALGASSGYVRWSVLATGMKLVVLGATIGTAGALAATRPLAAMLAGVSPNDPVAFAGTAMVLVAVGLAASYLPTRRATRIDPIAALRQP